ncbi:MAG: pilus assembly protein PilP [Myxococcota bacterium]
MRRIVITSVRALLLLGAVASLLAGCSEDRVMERPPDPRQNRPSSQKAGGSDEPEVPEGMVSVQLENPKWDLIEPHFQKFLEQKHTTPKDAFEPQVTEWIPRPAIEEEEDEAAATVEEEEEEPRGPLQQYPLAEYSLQVIMSGTAVPKAVVVDPKGQAYVIQRDTRLGDEGGIVESITQYMVVVQEPDSEEPVKLTIRPPFIDLASQVGLEADEARRVEEFTLTPVVEEP